MKQFLNIACRATILAGEEIMNQYNNGFETITKADGSPMTSADLAAHRILSAHLEETGITIISEEGEHYTHSERQKMEAYWCLDPIDGTKDFVNKTDEFCISVGLIAENTSKLGVLYAPALNLFYFSAEDLGSYVCKLTTDELLENLKDKDFFAQLLEQSERLPNHPQPETPTFLTSRFHSDPKTEEYIKTLKSESPNLEIKTMGCAIKLGVVSERLASEYTRFMSVNFWDIAGGHAIAKYAGLNVYSPHSKIEIDYTDEQMKVHGYSLKWDNESL